MQPELTHRFGVKRLLLFGSTARNEARPGSDVDLLVEFEGPATFDGYFGLLHYLETLLGRPVDLVTPRSLPERLRGMIEHEAIDVT
ncbi:MAG: nucleotidyltransferase family protein [Thiobacillaceae bacterium]|nr:nucleotidyltransferase family protein [Thiobacillaceae bacterium]